MLTFEIDVSFEKITLKFKHTFISSVLVDVPQQNPIGIDLNAECDFSRR